MAARHGRGLGRLFPRCTQSSSASSQSQQFGGQCRAGCRSEDVVIEVLSTNANAYSPEEPSNTDHNCLMRPQTESPACGEGKGSPASQLGPVIALQVRSHCRPGVPDRTPLPRSVAASRLGQHSRPPSPHERRDAKHRGQAETPSQCDSTRAQAQSGLVLQAVEDPSNGRSPSTRCFAHHSAVTAAAGHARSSADARTGQRHEGTRTWRTTEIEEDPR